MRLPTPDFSSIIEEAALARLEPINNNIKQMSKIALALKSRTVWTVVVLFLVNGVGAIHGYIPAGYLPLVDGILGILAIYFKLSPSQQY